ncbi:hypothetical protein ABPG72_006853 [Tetrahymena utriculariae]
MIQYNDFIDQNYQIAEMKEETNETDISMDRSVGSTLVSGKLLKILPQKIMIQSQKLDQSQQAFQNNFVRQPTTQSIYQPLVLKSVYSGNAFNPSSDQLIPDEMFLSKTYVKISSLKSPTQIPIQQGLAFQNKQILKKDIVYSIDTPIQIHKQIQQPQPQAHSYSFDNNRVQSFQLQLDDLKSRNKDLEAQIVILKKEGNSLENEKYKNKVLEEKIRELQWKIERQKNQPLPTLKRVIDSNEDYIQEINNINLNQENKILKERISSLEYDLKLAYSQSKQSIKSVVPTSQLEIENRKLINLLDELQRQNVDLTDKLMFSQTYKDKYNQLLTENQALKQQISDSHISNKLFGCFC